MTDTSEKTCNVHVDGRCAMHDVEIERRKSIESLTQKDIEIMQRDVSLIPKILTKLNTIAGWTILATVFIVGGFYYSSEIKADSLTAQAVLKHDIDEHRKDTDRKLLILTEQVSRITTTVVRNEEKHKALIAQMETLNDYLGHIIGLKNNGGVVK